MAYLRGEDGGRREGKSLQKGGKSKKRKLGKTQKRVFWERKSPDEEVSGWGKTSASRARPPRGLKRHRHWGKGFVRKRKG